MDISDDCSISFFRFLKDGGIDEYEDAAEYAPTGCVSFMTIHQSKGFRVPCRESSAQWMPSLANSTPSLMPLLQGKYYRKEQFEPLEETKNYDFWRLFYTAFSRAQNSPPPHLSREDNWTPRSVKTF